ncbi:MAG: hypothetical protein KDI30_05520 [Pseudomonadales bacterium]|nr:hypothetical protein [Pseudomonadales bacterium]
MSDKKDLNHNYPSPTEFKYACLEPDSFPKTCPMCNTVYSDEIDFFERTHSLPHVNSDIRPVEDENADPQVYLEIYRNCNCGTTLMELFHCRREQTASENRKRLLFEILLDAMEAIGHKRKDARDILFEFMHLCCPDKHECGNANNTSSDH